MMPTPPDRSLRGFTLMEVLAAVFLTSLVMTAAVAFYVNLSDASTRAAAIMREKLHASTVLDRVGRDIGGATLLTKPDEVDPLSHPWFFVADSQYAFDGADRIRLISRSQVPRVTDYHASDLAEVVYFTRAEEDGSVTLLRWVSPGLPARYVPTFPRADDERSLILAEGLRSFALRFLQEDGEWVSEWDSTQVVESSALPKAVEITISMLGDRDPEDPIAEEDVDYMTRIIVLPVPPLDLEGMIQAKLEAIEAGDAAGLAGLTAPGEDGGGGGGDVDCASLLTQAQAIPGFSSLSPNDLRALLEANMPEALVCLQ